MRRGIASIISVCCAVLMTACQVANRPDARPPILCITSASGAYWKTAAYVEAADDPTADADVTVDANKEAQTWEGFGGSFNEMGWNYLTTRALQDEAMQLLFGADGCHFAWGRIPIGASDYAMDRYTLDETPDDYSMSAFSIDRDKQKLIPFIQAARAVNPELRFWASPWTPPTWMKQEPYLKNSQSHFDGGRMKGDEQTLQAFALYLTRFVQAYAGQGIPVEVIAPQNEPNFEQNYPSCRWTSQTYTTFVPYLAEALRGAGLHTKIMLGTMSNANGDPQIITAVMNSPEASKLVQMIGVQWGVADRLTSLKNYNLPIWLTEHRCGNYPNAQGTNTTLAPNNQAYARESWGWMRNAIKGGVTSYNAWNMVLDKAGRGNDTDRMWAQNSLLVVDNGKIIRTPAYYVFRHFCQFVDPGAKVVETSIRDAVAFKNPDGSLVAVLYASQGKSNYTVRLGGKRIQFSMPADGWATVRVK